MRREEALLVHAMWKVHVMPSLKCPAERKQGPAQVLPRPAGAGDLCAVMLELFSEA
jgi:hypothetical protein